MKSSEKVAKIDNTFILNAQYRLTSKEQKVLYYLISHLDPKNETEFHSSKIPIRDIEEMLRDDMDTRYCSFYEKIDKLCASMISKNITFPSNLLIGGKPLKGRINFFSAIKPMVDETGESVIQFSFSDRKSVV